MLRRALLPALAASAALAAPASALGAVDVHVNFGSSPNTIEQGKRGAFKFHVRNEGDDPATEIVVRYAFPRLLAPGPAGSPERGVSCGPGVCTIAELAPSQLITIGLMATAVAPGTATVLASARAAQADSDPTDDEAVLNTTVLADRTPPSVGGMTLSKSIFRVGRGPGRGTRIDIPFFEPARVEFRIVQRYGGVRRGSRCKAAGPKARGRRCVGTRTVGTFRRNVRAKPFSMVFTGRVGRRTLRRGTYQLRARATDRVGNRSREVGRGFQIRR